MRVPLLFLAISHTMCTSIDELIADTMAAKSKLFTQSKNIDKEFSLTELPKKNSLMQIESLSEIQKEIANFEKSKKSILVENAGNLRNKKNEFLNALGILNGPSSFLEKEDFFDSVKQEAAKIHSVVLGITSEKAAQSDRTLSPSVNGKGLDIDLD